MQAGWPLFVFQRVACMSLFCTTFLSRTHPVLLSNVLTYVREAGDEIMHKRWMRHEYELEVAVAREDEL